MIELYKKRVTSLKIDEQQFKDMMYANERTVDLSNSKRLPIEKENNLCLALYYGSDDMNVFVFESWELIDNILYLDNPVVSVIDGVYNFYDYDTHKYYAIYKGITTGYRRRPKKNVHTNYKPTETYEYNGTPITEDIRRRLVSKFVMYDDFKLKNPDVHKCNKCKKDLL